MIHGVGLFTTMAVGLMTHTMDGFGYQVMNGRRHGFHGVSVAVIPVGLPLARVSALLIAALKAGGYLWNLLICTNPTAYIIGEVHVTTTPISIVRL